MELLIDDPILQDSQVAPLVLLGDHNFALLLHSELQIFMGEVPILDLDHILLILVNGSDELPFYFDIVVLDLVFVEEAGLLLDDEI